MKVRELLADPHKWARGCLAKDAHGRPVSVYSEQACSWCLIGAVILCHLGDTPEVAEKLTAMARCEDLSNWNDDPGRTHAEVLALVTEADV